MSKIQISCTIDVEDYEFCKTNQIKISQLLRNAINERKQSFDGTSSNYLEEKRRKEAFMRLSNKYREILEKHGILDEAFT